MEAVLYGTAPSDPATCAMVGGVLVVSALTAGTLSAWGALRIDPVDLLRAE